MYYMNQEVEVLGELKNGRVAIEIVSHTNIYLGESPSMSGPGEPDYIEPEFCQLIVNKSELTDKKILAIEVFEKEKAKMEAEIATLKENILAVVQKDRVRLVKEVQEMKSYLKKYEGLADALRFLDPEYKYLVTHDCIVKVLDMDNGKVEKKEKYSISYRAIAVKTDRYKKKFISEISDYSDGSGCWSDCEFFKTLDEVKAFLVEEFDKRLREGNGLYGEGNTIRKYELRSELIDKHMEEDSLATEKKRDKEIERKKKELERLMVE